MGREVRRVTKDWQHPKRPDGSFKPLHDGGTYAANAEDWLKSLAEKGLQETIDYWGRPPNRQDYMPVWADAEADHIMMYEDTSEGTPISPAFKTPEELARWLADNGASAFADCTASYEHWLNTINRGGAVSCAIVGGEIVSGVSLK